MSAPSVENETEPEMTGERTVRTFCRLCEVGCGLTATVDGNVLTKLRPDHDHPNTRGFACSKGLRGRELHADPDRLRSPQRRDGDRFVDISWDEALAEIGERLNHLIAEHGPRSVGVYIGNPTAFNALSSATSVMFPAMLGSDRVFSAATQDCTNKYAISELLYGTPLANPIPDLRRTELLLLIGSNPRVSGSSFMSVADPVAQLRGIRDRGGRVVFVNPLEIEPDLGETIQVRPGSDPYLLAAVLHEIHRTCGFRLGALKGSVEGVEDVVAFIAPYSPAAVAPVVGIPAEVISRLAQDFAAANGASIHASTGLNMSRQGALAYWLVQMLLLLTGNLDRPGGSYFATRGMGVPALPVDRTSASYEKSGFGPFRRAVGMMPSAVLPEIIDDPDEPLRALIVVAGNPALTVGGGPRLADALRSLDLLVSIDLYRNATGQLADFVLPATDQYEREDLNIFVQGLQCEPFVQWTPKITDPDGDQREEWRILGQLLQAMGRDPLVDPTTADPFPLLFDGVLTDGLTIGELRDAGGVAPLAEPGPGGSMERLGIVAPVQCVAEALRPTLVRGHALFAVDSDAERPGRFSLIPRRTHDEINSTLRNLPPRRANGAANPLWMHPDDADRLGIAEGAVAHISNDDGSIEAPVRYDHRLRTGVVAMTHGYGNRATTGMPVALARPGVNVNELAPHGPGSFDPVSGMSQLTGIGVDVRPA